MKKKVKLITTIASLCLAVALMAFGVYAALNVTYTVKTQVSYSAAANVKAAVTYEITFENVAKIKQDGGEEADYTAAITGAIWSDENGGAADVADGTFNLPTFSVEKVTDMANPIVFTYKITIANKAAAYDANKFLDAEITLPTDQGTYATDGYEITSTKDVDTRVGVDGTVTYSVTLKINPNASITKSTELDSKFVLTMKDADNA